MEVHTDFTSGAHTLVFDEGKQVKLSKQESIEFEKWFKAKEQERKGL